MTAAATCVFVKVLVRWTLVRLTDTLARVCIILIWMMTCRWICALTLTFVIVIMPSGLALFDVALLTLTVTGFVVEVHVVRACLGRLTLAATAIVVEVLSWITCVRLAYALTRVWIVPVWI